MRIFNLILGKGFTTSMMMAKTILLSKKECPTPMHDARPITILSCLYRLFGKMIFKSVSRIWTRFFPAPISGGLPGRGVKEIAFVQKRFIEDSLQSGRTCGGFSSDLIKAFNTFGRFAVARILNHLGIPDVLLDTWTQSLDRMVRYPTLNGCVGDAISSTTGVPEGCSISVLAMLGTSAFFYYNLLSPVVHPFAYADNWSWLTRQQQAHLRALELVKRVTTVLRLQIDFNKSWHWGTTKEFRNFCVDSIPSEDHAVIVKMMVKDLGEVVHYNKSMSLGFVKKKIQDSVARINRIESLPCSLQKKALMIQTSVFPMAFYSADTVYIGQHHFTTMRRAITHALVGNWHNASPLVACCGISKFLQDPFVYVLCHCARTIRRLANVDPEGAASAVKFAFDYEGCRPFGPAGTLKCYFKQVGWSLHEDGTVFGPELLQFNILRYSTKKIRQCIVAMWEHHVVDTMTRKGVVDYRIDFKLAAKLLSSMGDSEQHLLKLNVVGGFQTQQQKALWDENVVSACLLCGEPDTREHRLLSCKATLHVRAQHVEACRILSEYPPEWCYMPLPRQFDEIAILKAFIATIKIPPLDQSFNSGQSRLRFFTDGGALHPSHHVGRLAAWAVVQDLPNSELERRSCVDFLFLEPPQLPLFRVAAMGLVAGDQTVARGELQAIVVACRIALSTSGWQDVDFFTDASYVCIIIAMVVSGLFRSCLHKLPNADLILELDELWQRESFHVHKVKSHRSFDDASDLDDLWRIAGNFCADMVVGLAFKTIPSCIKNCADRAVAFQTLERSCLQCVFDYMVVLNKTHCELLNQSTLTGKGHTTKLQAPKPELERVVGRFDSQAYGQDALKLLCDFEPEGYTKWEPVQCDSNIFQMVLQGPNLGIAIKHWVESLRWPNDYEHKDPQDWGISWFEMMISFYIFSGMLFPIKVAGAGALAKFVGYHSDEATMLPPNKRTGALQAVCFRNVMQNLCTLLGERFFPTFESSRCSSMYRLGWRNECAGLPRRPILPNSHQTMTFIQSYLEKLGGVRALATPIYIKDLKPQLELQLVDEDCIALRYKKYMAFMKIKRRGD